MLPLRTVFHVRIPAKLDLKQEVVEHDISRGNALTLEVTSLGRLKSRKRVKTYSKHWFTTSFLQTQP